VLEPRPFLSREDLARARDAVAAASALVELALQLGVLPAPQRPDRIRLGALYLTALVNERLGRGFAVRPLPASELRGVLDASRSLDDPRLAQAGSAGDLLSTLARAAAEELEPLRAGDVSLPGAEAVTAVWLE
jgi:hypothetical protein